MKKQLLAGTAIVAAAMFVAGGAMAQDKKMMKPSISVNGYWESRRWGPTANSPRRRPGRCG